jgi:hypothetical protein
MLVRAFLFSYPIAMKDWHIALLLKPFIMLGLFALIVLPIERLFIRFWPNGRVKRFLLTRW